MDGGRLRVGLIGCGAMGRRYVAGYAELLRSDFCNLELVALCDLDEARADDLAEETRQLTGGRPRVFQSIATMVEAVDGLSGVVVATDIRAHHRVAIECIDRGLDILMEQPLALTMRACNLVVRAARRADRTIVMAEPVRRDPMSRLVRALIDDGAIGEPHMMIEASVRGADRITLSSWRHDKLQGGLVLDLGVHSADLMRYFLGEADAASGVVRLLQPVRRKGEDGLAVSKWASEGPGAIRATAEDALWALVRFRNGPVAQWCLNGAGRGLPLRQRLIYGSAGSVVAPPDGSGRSPRLDRSGHGPVTDDALLQYAPSYRLCPVGAHLFGGERPTSYRLPSAEAERKLIALQLHELGACALGDEPPEVSADDGRRDVALVYAVCESERLARFVSLDEVEDVRVDLYQREIDADLGLIEVPGLD
ncbi:MAG TPA: Gfo/Idh/MocA family oxidoreductase [Chloroflexota bacterium]|jgi:predicted dehydrogenase|nr:Gfo/Idh/MocA family oxidoreductase [Chloroflexota bacterium]